MSESLGLTSHKLSCNCTGCGMLRAGVCINCAEKIAAQILESGPGELAAESSGQFGHSNLKPLSHRKRKPRSGRSNLSSHVLPKHSQRLTESLHCLTMLVS